MQIINCRTNHLLLPMGFAMEAPVFSYVVEGALGKKQTEARIRVTADVEGKQVLADTGFGSLNSLGQEVPMALSPCTRYFWTVTVRTDAGEEATSAVNWFETGKREQPWRGRWISCGAEEARHPVFHKRFALGKQIERARLYICGLGLYEASINGQRVGQEKLTPFCNDYTTWIQYQTYDVTELLGQENELSVLLGQGWYLGRFTVRNGTFDPAYHGTRYKLMAELQVRFADGTETVVGTDDSWTVTRSTIYFSDIYDGEQRDDTLAELPPEQAVLLDEKLPLEDRRSIPLLAHEELSAVELIHTPAGETVFDIGQNIAGIFRLRVHEPKGTKIHIQTGEVLQQGNFYRENLRTAKSEYIYISDGQEHVLEPKFTYYGYRYAKVEGAHDLRQEDFTGVAYYSDVRPVATFKTGDEKLNQLMRNISWGQKGNFVDLPTDCPQRDERLGWTADTQVFVPTASFLTDSCAFYQKYLYDMRKEQSHNEGCVPEVIPAFFVKATCSVWGDAATIIPWAMYQFYGDVTILRDSLQSMKAWVDYIERLDGDNHHWREVFHYGDWLALDHPSGRVDEVKGGTEEGLIADAYYLNSVRLVVKSARILGETELAQTYEQKAERILSEIRKEYYTPNGRCAINTQTAQILSAYFDLSTDPERAHRTLVSLLHLNNNKLRTGFVGTPLLCRVLSSFGEDKLAYELIHNEEYPGWLYEINLGATTVWERWNSLNPDGTISSSDMNSFNHYAYGAIGEWMWRTMAGLNPCVEQPGFKRAVLRPVVDGKTGWLEAEYASVSGVYRVAWKVLDQRHVQLKVEIPFDCTASLELPYCKGAEKLELTPGSYEYCYETDEDIV